MIKNCPMRHENGNCLPAGGFCTANKNICEALHNAYELAKSEYEPVTAEDFAKIMSENTFYGFQSWFNIASKLMKELGFVVCKKKM